MIYCSGGVLFWWCTGVHDGVCAGDNSGQIMGVMKVFFLTLF